MVRKNIDDLPREIKWGIAINEGGFDPTRRGRHELKLTKEKKRGLCLTRLQSPTTTNLYDPIFLNTG